MSDRVLVIGLDSAPLAWVERWVAEGRMPNLGRLMANGAVGILRTVNPPLSPAAWSSFATGMLPAKHGVYDHVYRRPGSYDVAPTNSRRRMGKTLWQIIGEGGGKVGVINVPETYPPVPVNGFLLSGMDTPSDDADWAYPPELKAELERAVGGYRVFGRRSKENLSRAIAGMHETIPMRCRTAEYLWGKYQPDFMILVFMETDIIQHKCWKYLDPAHPEYTPEGARRYGAVIPDIYTRIDQELKPLLEQVDERTTVIIMSDHGAGPLYKSLYLNNWLVSHGLMHFKRDAVTRVKRALFQLGFTPETMLNLTATLRVGIVDQVTSLIRTKMWRQGRTTLAQRLFLSWADVDWPRTQAYALGGSTTGFYINLKGREPQGCVEPGDEYERVREEIMHRLMQWRDDTTGWPVVERVYRREELHQGPYADRMPDVIFTARDEAYVGFGAHEFGNKALMRSSPLFNAHHRMDGMVALYGPAIRRGVRLETHSIVDLAPTILYLLGYPIPADMDGRVMVQAFLPEFLAARQVVTAVSAPAAGDDGRQMPDDGVYSTREEGEVLERLKDLGYA